MLEADAAPRKPLRLPGPPAPSAAATAPTTDQILDKYIAAVGGADAIRKVTSRSAKGVIIANGKETPIELYTKAARTCVLSITLNRRHVENLHRVRRGSAGWMDGNDRPRTARDVSR